MLWRKENPEFERPVTGSIAPFLHSGIMGQMKTNRQYNHLIDLEYFCHQDADADDNKLHLRDRNIFLANQKELANGLKPSNRE